MRLSKSKPQALATIGPVGVAHRAPHGATGHHVLAAGATRNVVAVDAGTGAPLEEREVGLGVSDGTVVEVVSGLTDGEQVRQFVPGLAAPNEPVCYDDGMGGQFCEDPGWSW